MEYRCTISIPEIECYIFAIQYDKNGKIMRIRRLNDYESIIDMEIAYPDWIIDLL